MTIPIIGSGKNDGPVANFAKKEQPKVSKTMLTEMAVHIPPLYYWEDVIDGKSVLMTMAFKIHGHLFGMSYPIEEEEAKNFKKIEMLRQKLFKVVKESLDVLVHHGTKVLDSQGNIDPRLVNDQEALRFKYDQHWDKKVAAFNKLVRIAPITKAKAVELGLLSKNKA